MTAVEVFAPAKVNLTLHVTGRRHDGYHTLDSLVAFAPVGDRLKIDEGEGITLRVDGPEAEGVPTDRSNLVLRAAERLALGRGAAMRLTKRLPAASGLGGGSADAAAAIRGLLMFWMDDDLAAALSEAPDERLGDEMAPALALGADVPMCLLSRTCRARGTGEALEFVDLPPLPAVLANPRIPVPTPEVFAALTAHENPPMPENLPRFLDAIDLIEWLAEQRNDLEAAALALEPEIGAVIAAIRSVPGCRLARMSGSGATCFGLFDELETAVSAAETLRSARPGWWIAEGYLADWSARAAPQLSLATT